MLEGRKMKIKILNFNTKSKTRSKYNTKNITIAFEKKGNKNVRSRHCCVLCKCIL